MWQWIEKLFSGGGVAVAKTWPHKLIITLEASTAIVVVVVDAAPAPAFILDKMLPSPPIKCGLGSRTHTLAPIWCTPSWVKFPLQHCICILKFSVRRRCRLSNKFQLCRGIYQNGKNFVNGCSCAVARADKRQVPASGIVLPSFPVCFRPNWLPESFTDPVLGACRAFYDPWCLRAHTAQAWTDSRLAHVVTLGGCASKSPKACCWMMISNWNRGDNDRGDCSCIKIKATLKRRQLFWQAADRHSPRSRASGASPAQLGGHTFWLCRSCWISLGSRTQKVENVFDFS